MLRKVTVALLGLALSTGAATADDTTIKFTLGWKTQGSDAAFFYAKDNGYFKEEGLNVVIDQGEGSGATVTRVMSGAYDAGFGDVNAIIQNASTKPQEASRHGLHDVEPAAVRDRRQEDQRHQHHQGF
ncbi:ABC-type nitrate/sulfonate/bicarbonate transport system substrate-binding protein [Bradyrhizobium japonicum]